MCPSVGPTPAMSFLIMSLCLFLSHPVVYSVPLRCPWTSLVPEPCTITRGLSFSPMSLPLYGIQCPASWFLQRSLDRLSCSAQVACVTSRNRLHFGLGLLCPAWALVLVSWGFLAWTWSLFCAARLSDIRPSPPRRSFSSAVACCASCPRHACTELVLS